MQVNDETKKYIHHPGGQFTLEKTQTNFSVKSLAKYYTIS